jgi:hypothetical protein
MSLALSRILAYLAFLFLPLMAMVVFHPPNQDTFLYNLGRCFGLLGFEIQVATLRHHYKNLALGINGFSARARHKLEKLQPLLHNCAFPDADLWVNSPVGTKTVGGPG